MSIEVPSSAKRTDGMVGFSVSDNGIGIRAGYFDRIFGMFRRLHAHETYGGTRIGLAVVPRIVERHDASIRVEPTPGDGSTFFTLPAAPAVIAPDAPSDEKGIPLMSIERMIR